MENKKLKNLEKGKKIQKGQVLNPHGRPRKLVSRIANFGYTLIDIQNTIKNLLAYEPNELQAVVKNSESTVLEILVSKAIVEDIKRGGTQNLKNLMDRCFGMPKQETEMVLNQTQNVVIDWTKPIDSNTEAENETSK